MMPTVYVVQEPYRGRDSGEPVRDFTPAERYGPLRVLLPHAYRPGDYTGDDLLDAGLSNWKPGDYLICSGHPVAIGIATAIAASHGKPVNLLVWSGRRRSYDVSIFDPAILQDPVKRPVAVGVAGRV